MNDKNYKWGKYTCPKCGGIQTEKRNCFHNTYHHWVCSSCNFIEQDIDHTMRLFKERPDLLPDYLIKYLSKVVKNER